MTNGAQELLALGGLAPFPPEIILRSRRNVESEKSAATNGPNNQIEDSND